MNTESEIFSSLMLSRMLGLTQAQARALLQYYDTAEAAFADDAPVSEIWARAKSNRTAVAVARERVLAELDFCRAHNVRVIPFSSNEYPRLLKSDEVADAPINLFYCGNAPLDRRHILSVVGTRHITEYGKDFIEKLIAELANLVPDVLIISGLAYGVDIHAHRAALAHGLDTVAVLAHGHDRIYPGMHRQTANEMTRHGGLLTEYFSGTVPDKGNFVRRNRIVAGMAQATLVVESAEKGGALITAHLASGYGREVMALPGRVTDLYSAGCNRLIRDNKATLVTSAADVIDTLHWQPVATPSQPRQLQLFPMLTPEQQAVADALDSDGGLTVDQLSVRTRLSVSQLTDMLFDLEDLGVVKRLPGNRYRSKA